MTSISAILLPFTGYLGNSNPDGVFWVKFIFWTSGSSNRVLIEFMVLKGILSASKALPRSSLVLC